MTDLFLGIDLGTSGIRCAVVDKDHNLIAMTRGSYPDASALGWWSAVSDGLNAMHAELGSDVMAQIRAAAIDGTSGTMVLIDVALNPVTDPLMYNSNGFDDEAAAIADVAPEGHITCGSSSALARLLRLQKLDRANTATHMCHQADFILSKLRGAAGISDENNCLKAGYDPETGEWPDWANRAGVRTTLLPRVHPVGDDIGQIAPEMALAFGLSPTLRLKAGTTDSIAAFLATGASEVGEAVTSLGTTLAIKLMSDVRIEDTQSGIYSHKLGDHWLVGGASNSGGGALLTHFTLDQIETLGAAIDPANLQNLHYYPLPKPGERFPINDPALPPRITPRPAEDHLFLQSLLEGIAEIEARCYAVMAAKGAPTPTRIFTAGGGGSSDVWTQIRKSIVSPHIQTAPNTEAAIGVAILSAR